MQAARRYFDMTSTRSSPKRRVPKRPEQTLKELLRRGEEHANRDLTLGLNLGTNRAVGP
jgi:hypothetical protein